MAKSNNTAATAAPSMETGKMDDLLGLNPTTDTPAAAPAITDNTAATPADAPAVPAKAKREVKRRLREIEIYTQDASGVLTRCDLPGSPFGKDRLAQGALHTMIVNNPAAASLTYVVLDVLGRFAPRASVELTRI